MFKKLLGLLSDTAIYGISGSLRRMVGLVVVFILGHYVTPAEYGAVLMLAIVGQLFVPLANLGMTNAVFRQFNLKDDPERQRVVLSTGLASVLISALFWFVLGLIFAPFICERIVGDASWAPLLRVTLVGAVATSMCTILFNAMRVARQVKTAAAVTVLEILVHAGVTLTLVVGFDLGPAGLVWGIMVSSIIGMLAELACTIRRFAPRVDWTLWREMIDYGLPFLPSQLQHIALEMFGIYVVREMLGLEAAGLFGMASRFASPVSLVVNAVEASWIPYKFQIHANDPDPESFFQSAMVYYVAGLGYLWICAAIWGPELLRLLMPPAYHPAATLVWAVTLIPALQGMYLMVGTGFDLQSKTRAMPLVTFLGLLTVVVASLVLIKPFGAVGAALATVLAWCVMCTAIFVLSQRRFPIAYDWPTIGLFGALAAICVAADYAVQTQPLSTRLSMIALLTVVYPLLCTLIFLRSRDERGRVQYLLSKLRGAA